VLNQTVLLRGVNDSPDALAALFGRLAGLGVRPYYLHHPDRAPGTARFRVGLARGLEIFDGLRRLVRPEALPAYVIDLPDGSGKVPVACLERLGGSRWRAPSGYELEEVD
jgi:lysine 2,3-aminomutase